MNNGPKKGGPPTTFEILRKSPGLEDIWQGHLALGTPKEINTSESMIANLEPTDTCTGNWLKLSVAPDGKYTSPTAATGSARPTLPGEKTSSTSAGRAVSRLRFVAAAAQRPARRRSGPA